MRLDAPRLKILIVDADEPSSTLLRRTLESLGHEVVSVVDGVEAWERVQEGEFRLVISDWMMPGMDGMDLCRKVREAGAGPCYIYVILLTARSDREDRLAAYEAGVDDFLAKPLDRVELMARVGVARRLIVMQDELRRRSTELESAHADLRVQYERVSELAVRDGLTGLKNRRCFRESLDAWFSFAMRQRLPLSVVMIDVDHFKAYNDSFGHPAGDAALIAVGDLLRDDVREHDLVARYGGEEFVLLLSGTDGPSARLLCERLRERIAHRPWPLRPITVSIGLATTHADTADGQQLVDEADRALYLSKHRGRDCVTHFEETNLPVAI